MARKDELGTSELEIFIWGEGENPEDAGDAQRTEFLEQAQALLDEGANIAVYSTDSYPSAFEDCVPVADLIEVSGRNVLPVMLADGLVKVSYMYPTVEQMRRFSRSNEVKQKKVSAAAAACGTGGADDPATAPALDPAGFAATLAGIAENPVGGPEIGNRVNLMGGDFGDGIPTQGSVAVKGGGASLSITQAMMQPAAQNTGGCGCGGCGCGS
ncbi:arsenic metallochaperone ArsD family protein [Rothia sp. ZJ932]|uniref:arsenic metallochaperone ArsD family protein n=1 Tax=Rothia sp. ZJ932 TaxID=2810516 RepID=UPI0019678AD1|nr:arsenic metallochaperone ArsD family protein [Rothia sp. ZJ932]QRZ61637.1 arsenic metallochaperone ArsD family protein [Rothia sp. ZJ932]